MDLTRALAIDGYMHPEELRWLAERAADCQGIVEVGSYKGRSTRALCDNTTGSVLAIDPWDGGYRNDDGKQARWLDTKAARLEFEKNLADHLASGRLVQVPRHFRGEPPTFSFREGERIEADMVFLDGDHRYSEVFADIEQARMILKPGGILCGHDYGHPKWPGVKRAVDEFFGKAVKLCRSIWWVVS